MSWKHRIKAGKAYSYVTQTQVHTISFKIIHQFMIARQKVCVMRTYITFDSVSKSNLVSSLCTLCERLSYKALSRITLVMYLNVTFSELLDLVDNIVGSLTHNNSGYFCGVYNKATGLLQ